MRAIRAAVVPLALIAGAAAAGDGPLDCFNEAEPIAHSPVPEALRVTDADVERMLSQIAEHEQRTRALTESPPSPPPSKRR